MYSKELIETVCKTILSERGVEFDEKAELLPLVRRTAEALSLVPDGVPVEKKGSEIIRKLLGNLAVTVQSLAELRNLYGTGHGKGGKAKGLVARHGRLAAGAAASLCTFLYDTHMERPTT